MMKKSLYLLSLLCLISAPLTHSEVVFYSGFNDPDFCKRAEDEPPLTDLPNRQRNSYLQQQQAGTLPAPSSPLNINRFFSH